MSSNMDVQDLESAKGHILNVSSRHNIGTEVHHSLTLAVDQINDALEELNKSDSILPKGQHLGTWANES